MMQIHTDAIERSRVGDTCFVLQKSLDVVEVSDKEKLLEHLRDGWDIAGKYHNGTGYDSYTLRAKSDVDAIRQFIGKELLGFEVAAATVVSLSFQEFFAPVTCVSEGLNVDITFFRSINGNVQHENFRFQNENARRVRDLLFVLRVKQDKESVMDLIEKQKNLAQAG